MSCLTAKYNICRNAHRAFERSLEIQDRLLASSAMIGVDQHTLISMGVIKHFDLAYKTAGQFLKEYLYVVYRVKANSPKMAFRAYIKTKKLPDELIAELSTLACAYSIIPHAYERTVAQDILRAIEKHQHALDKILRHVSGQFK